MQSHRTLSSSDAVGRFAVAYVRKVCAHAHVGFEETSPGEDVLALDGKIACSGLDFRVQIKGTTGASLKMQAGTLSYAIEEKWREKWRQNLLPTYFIYVLLEKPAQSWLQYDPTNTLAGAYALWSRIDNLSPTATHVVFDRTDRFTAKTVGAWHDGVLVAGFGGGGASV